MSSFYTPDSVDEDDVTWNHHEHEDAGCSSMGTWNTPAIVNTHYVSQSTTNTSLHGKYCIKLSCVLWYEGPLSALV